MIKIYCSFTNMTMINVQKSSVPEPLPHFLFMTPWQEFIHELLADKEACECSLTTLLLSRRIPPHRKGRRNHYLRRNNTQGQNGNLKLRVMLLWTKFEGRKIKDKEQEKGGGRRREEGEEEKEE